MDNMSLSIQNETASLVIPAFRGSQEVVLSISKTREAESRLIEAKTVNPSTYADLEHTYGESYRELKNNLAIIGHQSVKAEKELKMIKAGLLLDKYPEFMRDKPKSQDNSDMREAFFMKDPEYLEAIDRVNMLKAMEAFAEGKIKVMENVSRWMRKQMDLVLRSGINPNLYVTTKE
jgi:hypothetical protein